MKAKRVQYTVNPGFAETNQTNIRKVMEQLRGKGDVGVQYAAYVHEDGRTFTHLLNYRDEQALSVMQTLETFKAFQGELRPNLEVPPVVLDWDMVGSSLDV